MNRAINRGERNGGLPVIPTGPNFHPTSLGGYSLADTLVIVQTYGFDGVVVIRVK